MSLSLVLLCTLSLVCSQAATVTSDKPSYEVDEDIVITFQGGPGNAKDWIGVYPEGVTPGDVDSTLWSYVDGTTGGSTGVTDGSITFTGGLPAAGTWVAHLLENDSYTSLTSVTFDVTTVGPAPRVAPLHFEYIPGEDIVISFANGPGNTKDWIGIYPEGITPGDQPSTLWFYVDNTQDGNVGLREGTVTFPGGLDDLGQWKVCLLLDDGYTVLAEASLATVDPQIAVLLRMDSNVYAPSQPITVNFTNGYGNPKDWIGIYPAGQIPGQGDSLLWSYTDGTQDGTTGVIDGSVTFLDGLPSTGDYVAYFLYNDTYDIEGRDAFTVTETIPNPRLLSIVPANNSNNNPPIVEFTARLTNGVYAVDSATLELTLDGATVTHHATELDGAVTVTYTNATFFAAGSTHTFELSYSDDNAPPASYSHSTTFTVGEYRDIVLPEPLFFEDFDNTPEGELPAGWTEESYTEIVNPEPDLGNLDSLSYATWTVVEASRFEGPLVGYSDGTEMYDYQRVLTPNPLNIVNGEIIRAPLPSGRFVFGNSGYRQGRSQVLYLYTPDYDLSTATDVHVAYRSIWEQNQDSIGAAEYSVDGGQSWLPIIYMLDGPDIVLDAGENVDAMATLTTVHGDVASYVDPDTQQLVGGTYGTFIAAPVSQALAPYISARIDNDTVGSKRVEIFRLPDADGASQVRFRFAHAGTDSWYFGIDDFGLYSISETPEAPTLTLTGDASEITISWPIDVIGYTLESKDDLNQTDWTPLTVSGNTYTVTPSDAAKFYRLRQ